MNVSIVIPNWNGRELLKKNLPEVLGAKDFKENHILEIIVVDDGSTDDSVLYLKKEFKDEVRVVVHTKNRGFVSTVNTGVRTARGELVCLLNSDVVPSNNFLEEVVGDFEDEQVFAVSLHEKGYGAAKGKFVNGFIEHEGIPEKNHKIESFWASGGSAVTRRSIWMKLKGLDERLFSPFYWEDVDISYRAYKRGYKVLWEPNANVIHEHESTVKKLPQGYVSRIRERNQLLFIWKNLTSKNLFRKHLEGLLKRILRHPGYLWIVFMAIKNLGEVRRLRGKERKESIISDEAIFAKF